MSALTPQELGAIRLQVGHIIDQVVAGQGDIAGPRSWKSTMWCSEVRAWIDDYDKEGISVFIDGASPDATNLQNYVHARLEPKYGTVDVTTEW